MRDGHLTASLQRRVTPLLAITLTETRFYAPLPRLKEVDSDVSQGRYRPSLLNCIEY